MTDISPGIRPIRAAGGVLWRGPNDGRHGVEVVEVAVVHRSPLRRLEPPPRGKLGRGETDLEAALREVEEETGYRGSPRRSLGSFPTS